MRPMFRYFGSKWQMAKHYGRPRRDLVIEPFAGSACYSTYWSWPNVKLYDINEEVCLIWDYLINCSENDIRRLPDWIERCSQLFEYSYPEERLMARWVWYGLNKTTPRFSHLTSYSKFRKAMLQGGDEAQTIRNGATFWCPAVKNRIIKQKKWIKNWTIDCCSYNKVPNLNGHWHIDPPYVQKPGQSSSKYHTQDIDYVHLAEWSKSRDDAVDVCEEHGARWLPFQPIRRNMNLKNRHYIEVVWRKDLTELF